MNCSDVTGFILIVAGTFDDVTITQTNAISREQTEIAFFGSIMKSSRSIHSSLVIGKRAQAPFRVMRVNR